jgi:hypothetical protein
MKFRELYNRVFVSEQTPDSTEDQIATPEDIDVEGAPIPSDESPAEEPAPGAGAGGASDLTQFRNEIKSFIDKLNGEQSSLETLLAAIDVHGTPWDGISGELNSDILRATEALSDIVIAINSRFNNSAKNPTVS